MTPTNRRHNDSLSSSRRRFWQDMQKAIWKLFGRR